ncbi:hypothetical protein R4Y45_03340 [Holzapfeliella sp. He02]|uniref:Uncharacterized protein n=1 Tax=Holzapfeliella saturejae TaxID=3082953 RepID=A0ABU8SFV0_9LACO
MIDILYLVVSLLLCYFLVWQRLNVKFVEQKRGIIVKFAAFVILLVLLVTAMTQAEAIRWSVLLLLGIFCIVLIFFRPGLGSIVFKNYRIRSYKEFTSFNTKQINDYETKVAFYARDQVRLTMYVRGNVNAVSQFLNKYFV